MVTEILSLDGEWRKALSALAPAGRWGCRQRRRQVVGSIFLHSPSRLMGLHHPSEGQHAKARMAWSPSSLGQLRLHSQVQRQGRATSGEVNFATLAWPCVQSTTGARNHLSETASRRFLIPTLRARPGTKFLNVFCVSVACLKRN